MFPTAITQQRLTWSSSGHGSRHCYSQMPARLRPSPGGSRTFAGAHTLKLASAAEPVVHLLCSPLYGRHRRSLTVSCSGLSSSVDLSPASNDPPTITSQKRWLLILLPLAMALCNADRVIMSVEIVNLSSRYNWGAAFAGFVQSSFLWGYMISPTIGGSLSDRYGGKIVMASGLFLWSLATMMTPLAVQHSTLMLFAARILVGIGEGVAMPCMNIMVSRWFDSSERARSVGLCMMGFHLGSVIGLVITPLIITHMGQCMSFIVFGILGAIWLPFWLLLVKNNPQSEPTVKMADKKFKEEKGFVSSNNLISDSEDSRSPLLVLLRRLPTWTVISANFMHNWGYFILLSWMPVYFNKVYGTDLRQAAWFSAVPWTMMATFGYIAGMCSDFLIVSGMDVTIVRKIMQSIGFVGPAIALLGVNASQSARVAAAWLTIGVGASSFSQAGFLVNFQEIAPRYAGFLHGISNTVGTMGAIISTIGTGYFVQLLGSFQAFLTLTAVMYFLSACFWNAFATGKRVFD